MNSIVTTSLLTVTMAIFATGCMTAQVHESPLQLDCQGLAPVRDDTPDFLRARSQVIELVVARGGKYGWRSKSWFPDELQNALVREGDVTRITEIRLRAGGEPSSLGNLMEVSIIATAVCATARFERNGELHEIKNGL